MITLKQAIDVLRIEDHILIWFVFDEATPAIEPFAMRLSVKQLKEEYDLETTSVTYIKEERALYDGEFFGYKFVIKKEEETK